MQTAAPPADEVFEPAPVGSVALNYAEETPHEYQLLDIAVNVFEVELHASESEQFGSGFLVKLEKMRPTICLT